jgi:integrase
MVAVLRLVGATGARRGELCALRRGDVDLTAGVLTIARAVVDTKEGGVVEKDTKTHGQRTVSLDSATVAAVATQLAAMAKRAADTGVELASNPFLFSHALDCSRPLRPDHVTGAFRRLCARAGLTDIRFHGLRHMHATYLLDAGVSVKTVSERLGHANASTTTDIYGHAVDGRDRAAADVMGGLLDG